MNHQIEQDHFCRFGGRKLLAGPDEQVLCQRQVAGRTDGKKHEYALDVTQDDCNPDRHNMEWTGRCIKPEQLRM